MSRIVIGDDGDRSGSATVIFEDATYIVSRGVRTAPGCDPIPWVALTWRGVRFDVFCNLKQHTVALRYVDKKQWAKLLEWCIAYTTPADLARLLITARAQGVQEGREQVQGALRALLGVRDQWA